MPTGPSSSLSPYLLALEPNVTLTSLITVGDPLPGSTTGVFAGIADGIGMFDNGNGTLTVLVNHELNNTQGTPRDHGSVGAFIDRLIVDKATLAVISGDDAMQTLHLWNDATDSYVTGTTAFSRFCSGDLAPGSAFFDAASGLGTNARIYLTGEESGVEGRAIATIVSGANAGHAYELPYLGNLSFENATANPLAQQKTIVALTDDGTNGQVYIYVGTKQATGSDIDKAGLSGGALYGIKVAGFVDETNGTPVSGAFTLDQIGTNGDASNMTGAQIDAESELEQVTSFLRPEDSAWDPQHPDTLYFTTTNSFTGNSRVYKAVFTDIAHPELGGTITAVLDGSEGQKMFDNLSVANGHIILQEDPGNQPYVSRVWDYEIATDTLKPLLTFDPAKFTPAQPGFITQDEESSGVIDVSDVLGNASTRAYLLDAQVHAATGDPATVEMGQLLLMKVETPHDGGNGNDVVNGDASANVLSGNNGDDVVRGGSGNDVLHGDNGADRIEGGADNDLLWGDKGNDVLLGDAGDDVLVGGRGNDTLTGGAGSDRFDFSRVDDGVPQGLARTIGTDRVTDFVHGQDLLVFFTGDGIKSQDHSDLNGDGAIDTTLHLLKGGTIQLLSVGAVDSSDYVFA